MIMQSSTVFEQNIKLDILPQYVPILKKYFIECNVNLHHQKEFLKLLLIKIKTDSISINYGICNNLLNLGSICAYDFISIFGGVLYQKNINYMRKHLDNDTIFELLSTISPIPSANNTSLWEGQQLQYRIQFINWIIKQIDIIIAS